MKKLLALFLLTVLPAIVRAQEKLSVVTLKNGTEIKGTIKSIVPTDSLTIVISGIETSIKMSDVALIEEAKDSSPAPQTVIKENKPIIERDQNGETFIALTNEGRFCFTILSKTKKTVEITQSRNVKFTNENLIIPSEVEYKGDIYTVIAIGEEAFHKNKNIRTVVFPNTIKLIGEEAFELCAKLTHVKFSPGLEVIGEEAFSFCTKLSEIELPQGLIRIEEQAFQGCAFERIDIPNTVKFIGFRAFFSANGFIAMDSKIKWLSIPESVVEIEKHAFCKFINLYGMPLPSKCHVELLPSWLSEDDAKRIGISEDSYRDYKYRRY